jgi:hypothetical protein
VKRFFPAVFVALALVVAAGCGGGGEPVTKIGERFVVVQNLERERFEATYGENPRAPTHTNGAHIEIPEGTVLEVIVTPRNDANIFEVRPVKAYEEVRDDAGNVTRREVTDEDELAIMFVQERYRTYDFLFYTIFLNVDYIDTKLRKVE